MFSKREEGNNCGNQHRWQTLQDHLVYYQEKLNEPNLQWIGKRKTATGEVNVFRNAFRDHDNDRDWSIDFWIDAKTKQLVAVYDPGADIYDPET